MLGDSATIVLEEGFSILVVYPPLIVCIYMLEHLRMYVHINGLGDSYRENTASPLGLR